MRVSLRSRLKTTTLPLPFVCFILPFLPGHQESPPYGDGDVPGHDSCPYGLPQTSTQGATAGGRTVPHHQTHPLSPDTAQPAETSKERQGDRGTERDPQVQGC